MGTRPPSPVDELEGSTKKLMLPGLGALSVWEAGAARGVTAQQWVCLGLHDNDSYAASCGHGAADAVLPSLETWRSPIAAALRMGYRVVCPNFYSNPHTAQAWNNAKTTKIAQQMLLKVFSLHGSRVLLMGDGQGGKVALKLLGEMPGLSNLLVGAMVFNMPAMRKESFAKLPANIPICMHLATDQGSTSSQVGRKLKDLSADARGVQDLADTKAKMQQLVLLRDRVLFAPTAAAMIPDTPFAGALEEVASWLRRHGMLQYAPMFRAAAVTPQLCNILDEAGWAALWAGELMGVSQQDRARIIQVLPNLLNRDDRLASVTSLPTFGSPVDPAPVVPAPAAISAGAIPPAGGYNVPARGSAFGSSESAGAAPSPASLNVRVLLSAEQRGEFSPPGSEQPPSVVGGINVPATISSFAEARSAVEAQLAGKLPPSFVFLRHGAPVGKKQEARWRCELSPTSLDLFIRGRTAETPIQTSVAHGAGLQLPHGQTSAEAAPVVSAAPPDTAPESLDMFSGMEIAGDDFMAEMDALSAAAPPPVAKDVLEAELEFTGGIKRGGKKKRKAKAKARVEAIAETTASSVVPVTLASGSSLQPSAPDPFPTPAFAAPVVEDDQEYRVDPSDGYEYTRAEFIDAYGGTAEWDAAAPAAAAAAVESSTAPSPTGSIHAGGAQDTFSVGPSRTSSGEREQDSSSDMSAVELARAAQEARLARITTTETHPEAVARPQSQPELADSVDAIRASVKTQMMRTAQLLASEQTETSPTSGDIFDSTGSIYDAQAAVGSEADSASSFDFTANQTVSKPGEGGAQSAQPTGSIYDAPAADGSQPGPEPVPELQTGSIYDSLESGGAVTGEPAPSGFGVVAPSAGSLDPASGASGAQSAASTSTGSIYDAPAAVGSDAGSVSSFDFTASQPCPEPEPVSASVPQAAPEAESTMSSAGSAADRSTVSGGFDLSFMSQKPSVPSLDPASGASGAQSASSTGSIYDAPAAVGSDAGSVSSFDFIASQPGPEPEPELQTGSIYDSLESGGAVTGEPAPSGFGVVAPSACSSEPASGASGAQSAASTSTGSIYDAPAAVESDAGSVSSFDFIASQPCPEPEPVSASVPQPQPQLQPAPEAQSAASAADGSTVTGGFDLSFMSQTPSVPSLDPASGASGAQSASSTSTGSIYDAPAAVGSDAGSVSSFDFTASQPASEPEPELQTGSIYDSLESGGAVTGEPAPSGFGVVAPSACSSEPASGASGAQSASSTSMGSIYDAPAAVGSDAGSVSSFNFIASQPASEPEPVSASVPQPQPQLQPAPEAQSAASAADGSTVTGGFDLSFMSQKPSVPSLDPASGASGAQSASSTSTGSIYDAPAAVGSDAGSVSSFDFTASQPASEPEPVPASVPQPQPQLQPAPKAESTMSSAGSAADGSTVTGGFDLSFMSQKPSVPSLDPASGASGAQSAASTSTGSIYDAPAAVESDAGSVSSFDFIASQPCPEPEPVSASVPQPQPQLQPAPEAQSAASAADGSTVSGGFDLSFMSQKPSVPSLDPASGASGAQSASSTSTGSIYDAPAAVGSDAGSVSSFDFIASQPASEPEPELQTGSIYDSHESGGAVTGEPAPSGFGVVAPSAGSSEPASGASGAQSASSTSMGSIYDAPAVVGSDAGSVSSFDFIASQPCPEPEPVSASVPQPQPQPQLQPAPEAQSAASAADGSTVTGGFDLSFMSQTPSVPSLDPASGASGAQSASSTSTGSIYDAPAAVGSDAGSVSSFDFTASQPASEPEPELQTGSIYDSHESGGAVTGEPASSGFGVVAPSAGSSEPASGASGAQSASSTSMGSIYDAPAAVGSDAGSVSSFDFIASQPCPEPEPVSASVPQPQPQPQLQPAPEAQSAASAADGSTVTGGFDLSFMSQTPSVPSLDPASGASGAQSASSTSTGSIYDAPAAVGSDAGSVSSFDFIASHSTSEPSTSSAQSATSTASIYDAPVAVETDTRGFDLTFMSQKPSVPSSLEPDYDSASMSSPAQSAVSSSSFDFINSTRTDPPETESTTAPSSSSFDFIATSVATPDEPADEAGSSAGGVSIYTVTESDPAAPKANTGASASVADGQVSEAGSFDLSFMTQSAPVPTLCSSTVMSPPSALSGPSATSSAASASSFDFITSSAVSPSKTEATTLSASQASSQSSTSIYDTPSITTTVVPATTAPQGDLFSGMQLMEDAATSEQPAVATAAASTPARGISGFDFIHTGSLTPGGTVHASSDSVTTSIYDTTPAPAPPPASAGGFTFVPNAELPDIDLKPAVLTAVPASATASTGFGFINSGGDLTPGGTVTAAQTARAPAPSAASIYDTVPAPAPPPASAGGFTFVPNAELPDIDLKPVPTPDFPMIPAMAVAATVPAAATPSTGFGFINSEGDPTLGGTFTATQAAQAPAPSTASIYDTPSVLPEDQAMPVNANAFNRRVGDVQQTTPSRLAAPTPAPAPAAGGFTFAPGTWDLASNEEKRTDPADGQLYTRSEFISQYGSAQGAESWDAACPT